jgi:hypothetical protein
MLSSTLQVATELAVGRAVEKRRRAAAKSAALVQIVSRMTQASLSAFSCVNNPWPHASRKLRRLNPAVLFAGLVNDQIPVV